MFCLYIRILRFAKITFFSNFWFYLKRNKNKKNVLKLKLFISVIQNMSKTSKNNNEYFLYEISMQIA